MKIMGVIPSRYGSTRLPGKALKDICGYPMVWWVYQQAIRSKKIDEIIVATDDQKIIDVCNNYSIPSFLTDKHPTAAHRLQELSESIHADYYIQINGDEPLMDYKIIDAVIPENIPLDTEFGSNVITPINNPVELMDPSNIKVMYNNDKYMMYMSRNPIPSPQGTLNFKYYKHVGVIGFNKKMLDFYKNSKPGYSEIIENIDPLRFLDYSKPFKVCIVDECISLSVDTEKDLEKIRILINEEIKKGNIPFYK